MTNTKLLREKISNSGITIVCLAKQAGMDRKSFYMKMDNQTEFKASEIVKIAKILKLTNKERDDIFLKGENNE